MSYVIQNFHKLNSSLVVTPRFKIFFSLVSINFFLFFFKFINEFKFKYLKSFYTFFFSKGLTYFFYNLNQHLFANYSNKLVLTGVYWNFKNLNDFLNLNNEKKNVIKLNNFFFFNLYFLSIKILNVKLTKSHFKNVFFFIILYFSEYWYQFAPNLKFYLNFIFVKNNFKLYRFYNNFFFKIYNF